MGRWRPSASTMLTTLVMRRALHAWMRAAPALLRPAVVAPALPLRPQQLRKARRSAAQAQRQDAARQVLSPLCCWWAALECTQQQPWRLASTWGRRRTSASRHSDSYLARFRLQVRQGRAHHAGCVAMNRWPGVSGCASVRLQRPYPVLRPAVPTPAPKLALRTPARVTFEVARWGQRLWEHAWRLGPAERARAGTCRAAPYMNRATWALCTQCLVLPCCLAFTHAPAGTVRRPHACAELRALTQDNSVAAATAAAVAADGDAFAHVPHSRALGSIAKLSPVRASKKVAGNLGAEAGQVRRAPLQVLGDAAHVAHPWTIKPPLAPP